MGLHIVEQTTISNDGHYDPYIQLTLTGNTSISNLAKGTHTLEIKYGFYYAWPNNSHKIDYIVLSSAFTEFTVDSDIIPGSEPIIILPSPTPSATSNVTPPPILIPTKIKILSPKNNFNASAISILLVFNVSAPVAIDAIESQLRYVYYETDWQTGKQYLYSQNLTNNEHSDISVRTLQFNTTLSNIPEGTHKLQVVACWSVTKKQAMFVENFDSETDASVIFSVNSLQSIQPSQTSSQFSINQTQIIVVLLLIAVLITFTIVVKYNIKRKKVNPLNSKVFSM